jgi:fibronectin type 3 domain-containing protein
MEPFRFARGRCPSAASDLRVPEPERLPELERGLEAERLPEPGRVPAAAGRRSRRWLVTLAATSLAAVLAGGPALLPGPGGSGVPFVLAAMQGRQARILNPGPPTGLTATAGNAQVSLAWTAPAEDGGAAIIGYNVFLGTGPGGESASPVNSSLIAATGYTVPGLANGTTYYFTVEAVNDGDLNSAPSGEASATPVAPVTAPGAPTGLAATAGDAQVSLAWTAPASTGGAAITGYNVYEGTSDNFKDTVAAVSTKGTGVTITKLTNGTTYYFRVTAVNDAGEGPASGAAAATPAAAITAPGVPTGLTATPGNGRVTLSWTAPASDGGAGITGYVIYQGTSPGGESASPAASSKSTGATITKLTNGTTYYFKVAAVNEAKEQGKDSGEATATPASAASSASARASASASASARASASASATSGLAGAPGAPGAPTGLTATPGNGEVGLSWTAPASGPASYNVYEGTSQGFSLGTAVKSTASTSTTVTGLTNGTTYYFVVTAMYSNGQASGSSGEASAEPTQKAVLTAKRVSTPVLIALVAVAVAAIAGAAVLGLRLLRPRRRPPLAPPSDVRAVPDKGRPPVVSVHEIGVEETYIVRLEPLPAAVITTLEEVSG